MEATAFDPDGTVTNLSFLVATNELGTDASEPYAWSWQSPPPGAYKLSVKPADDRGGVSISRPVDVFINTIGGVLLGSVGPPAVAVDLTSEGTLDWAHWGLLTNNILNRKVRRRPTDL